MAWTYDDVEGTWSYAHDAAEADQSDYTADAVIAEQDNESQLEADRAAQAEAAGVSDARFAGYAESLEAYEARSDVETGARRRAREVAPTFAEADFARTAEYGDESDTDSA